MTLDAIELASKNGANLTRQLLTFARRQRLNPVAVDLGERVDAFRDLLLSSLGAAVQFSTPRSRPMRGRLKSMPASSGNRSSMLSR